MEYQAEHLLLGVAANGSFGVIFRLTGHGQLGEFDLAPESGRSPKPQIWLCLISSTSLTAYSRPSADGHSLDLIRQLLAEPEPLA